MDSAQEPSDALVFFGATGDLARKQIFPALFAISRRNALPGPMIGAANAGWTIAQLREYARQSIADHTEASRRGASAAPGSCPRATGSHLPLALSPNGA